jgi:histidyl-tRNA synthetase
LRSAGIEYHVEPHLVRGLDYYTRTVFEWTTDSLGSQSTVCAGGRYDGLVAQLGGIDTPGVGWAMGQERIVMLLQKQNLAPQKPQPRVYLVLVGERAEVPGFKLAEQLRDAWPELALQVNLGGGSFKTQFKRADKSGAEFALVLGDDEAARGVVAVKALRQEAAQEECALEKISERVGTLLGLKGGSGVSHG